MRVRILVVWALLFCAFILPAQERIEFPSKDGLTVVADLYEHEGAKRYIVLFHQAGSSRGEYKEIAPKLNELGFSCLAVDQRSGNSNSGVVNETARSAKANGLATGFTDAYQDIEAAIKFASERAGNTSPIIWGSSYSSSLVLKYAGENSDVAAVLSFSPGEYFRREGKPGDFITSSAKGITCPAFITSAKKEKDMWWNIYQAIPESNRNFYLPDVAGRHGSGALWSTIAGNEGYWKAVRIFLEKI